MKGFNSVGSSLYLHRMKKYLLLLSVFTAFETVAAQKTDDSVKAVVNKLFAAMKNSDGENLKECFADSAILQTVTQNGQIRNEAVSEFANSIARLPKGDADERITFDVVKTDGELAIVWAPYQFFFKGKFSHCGVDSFQLVRIKGTWKIQYLIDTRRTQNCN